MTWLKHHREPWAEVLKKWELTFDLRQSGEFNNVVDLVGTWPVIGDPRAVSLVHIYLLIIFKKKLV